MMRNNIYNKVLGLAVAALTLAACADTWNDHFEGSSQGAQDGSLWQAIKQNSNLSNFASVVAACGYDMSLDGTQVFTVFAPTNDHFSSEEAAKLITQYNQEKGKVSDDDNSVIKEFVQNHIALFNHSVSPSSNDSLTLMNGKNAILTSGSINNASFLSTNQLYRNGVLFVIGETINYEPTVFEYLRKDADLDSLSSFFYNSRFYRREFLPEKSVQGGFVDGKAVYLDSVFMQQNDLFYSDFLNARLNQEDSTYWMVAPTNEVWRPLIEEYSQYFNYDDQVTDRDSLAYTNSRMAIVAGTIFSRTFNTDAAIADSAISTNAVERYAWRQTYWGANFMHYFQFGDGTGYSQQKPLQGPNGIFSGTENVECSNGLVMKTKTWNINPLNTFYQWIRVEAEDAGSIQEVSKVKNTTTEELEETITPRIRYVNGDNHFYGMMGENCYVEFEPTRTTVNHDVTFNIRNVLSNIGYDIYLVAAPALANDSDATEIQRLPTKLRCTINFHDQKGDVQSEVLQSSVTTTPDIVDYILLAEDYKFPCSSFGVVEEVPQINLKVETRVSSSEQRSNTFTRTMNIDCILLVPHGISAVTDDSFLIAPHGDGVGYYIPTK